MNFRSLMRGGLPLLIATSLLFAAGAANAAGNTIPLGNAQSWTIYAFGNAQSVADAFRAMHNFSQSAVFQNIFTLVAVLGILAIGIGSGFNSAVSKRFVGYCVGAFMVSYVFFGVNNDGPLVVNVEVIDTVDNTWKAPVTVPAVIGIPAAIISTAGYEITRQIEASFPVPDELKMSNGAPFNLSASLISDATQARISDPNIAQSMAFYIQDCFTIGVGSGRLNANTLISSTNFLEDIRLEHPGVMVSTLLKTNAVGINSVDTCPAAHGYLKAAIDAMPGGAAAFLKSASAWAKTPALSVVNAAADKVISYATNGSAADGGGAVKQAAVLASFKDSYRNTAAATGNNEILTTLAITQATESQRTSWIVGAEVFNRMMGYIFAVIQVFVYAVTPLVMLAALVPGLGFALLKNFLQIVLWLAMWQPMLAVVNFIILSMQQSELGGALGSAGTFTMATLGMTTEKAANMRAAATFVGTMVPALAWAMVKGSVDFSRVIGSAVGENFAQQAANTMTTGNFSLNQGSMDSFTSNKHSTAATSDHGNGYRNADGVASRMVNTGGHNVSLNGAVATKNVSDSKTINDGGQAGSQASSVRGGSDQHAGSQATNNGRMGSSVHSNSVVDSELGVRGATVGAQAGIQAGLAKPSGGGGGNGSNGNGVGPNGQGAVQAPTDVERGAPSIMDNVKVSGNGGLNGGMTIAGQKSLQRVNSNLASGTDSAGRTDNAQRTLAAQEGNTAGKVANKTEGYGNQRGVTEQAAATGQAAVDFNQQFISNGSFADTGLVSMSGNSNPPSTLDANRFGAEYENRVGQVGENLGKLEEQAEGSFKKGMDSYAKIKKESDGKLGQLYGAGKGSALTGKSPIGLVVEEMGKTKLGELAGSARETLENLGQDAVKQFKEAGSAIKSGAHDIAENFNQKMTPAEEAKVQSAAASAGLDKPVQHSATPYRGHHAAPASGNGNAPANGTQGQGNAQAHGNAPGNRNVPANGQQGQGNAQANGKAPGNGNAPVAGTQGQGNAQANGNAPGNGNAPANGQQGHGNAQANGNAPGNGNAPVAGQQGQGNAQAHGNTPGQQKSTGDTKQPGADRTGNGKEVEHASNEKPKGAQPDKVESAAAPAPEKRPGDTQGQQMMAQAPSQPISPPAAPPTAPTDAPAPQPIQPLPPTQLAQAPTGPEAKGNSLADNLTNTGGGNEAREMQNQVLTAERRAEQAERSNKEAGVHTFAIAEASSLEQAKTENQQLQAILKV
ncbi:conjugal transfer protein TraG N-terminal domain-containing protein [Comamonas thiooxydans]|uniref:conjugal transfer protein TraG N-terminal domain-containing protein n=1 Tax=Comamonas thiooxydans TaxID=363952 RepID=UPI000B41EFF9|nr:conjugal transfer protein TraG N-terminal domain-containing protein [Comamonas thiooxydans]